MSDQERRVACTKAVSLVLKAVSLVLAAGVVTSITARRATAQETPPQSTTPPGPPQEIGGRLVITGETVVVVADADRPPKDASIATKTDTTLLETPRSISVTERRSLDDRLATNIADAHDYTVGLMPADERGPAFARGFPISFYDLRRDGLRTYAWSVREPVGVERIQYLRGPAGILYGDGSPGGLVNMVLRKPLPLQRAEVTASGGGLSFGRVTGDVTGPIIASRRVRYRLIGAAEWLDNGFDNDERRLSFLPMLSFDVNRAVTVHVDSEFYHQRGRNYWHTVPATADTQHGDFSRIPWSLNTASPDDGWSGWNSSPGVRLDAQLRPHASLHSAFRYTRIGGNIDGQGLVGLAVDGHTLNRYDYLEKSTWQEWQSDTFLAVSAASGRVQHKLVVGAEAGLSTTDSEIGVGAGTAIDMYQPLYPTSPAPPAVRPIRYDVMRLGVYAQDQMSLRPWAIVVPSLRWSRIDVNDRVATSPGGSTEPQSSDYKVSPSLGIVILLRPWLSAYATGSQGFEPPSPGRYLEDGRALSLSDATALEGGVKADALRGRLSITTSAYRIRRTNIAEADGRGFFRQIGEGRSHGVEAELTGQLAAGLSLQAAYAWTDTEITRSILGSEGNELPNAPRHNASLWTRYRFREGHLAGVMIAGGVVHVSDRFLAGNNVTIAPAYTRMDFSATYEFANQHLRLGAAVHNATNVRYVTSGGGQALYAGAPRRLVLQLSSWF